MSEGYIMTELGELPESWEIITLEEISDFITKGSTPTTYGFGWVDSGILFLRSECVGSDGFTLSGSMQISEDADRAMERSQIKGGDILMTITGNVGRVCMLPSEIEKANINQHIARIRITDKNVNVQFIYQYLSQQKVIDDYNKITTGQAYPQLSLKQVRETKIPLPPLKEQHCIAEILSTVDEKIDVIDAQISQAQDLKKGLMQRLLTRGIGHSQFKNSPLGEIPESWEVAELNTVFKNVVVGFVGSITSYYCSPDLGIPFIRTLNVKDGYFDLSGIEYVTYDFHNKNKKSQIANEDILIARVGANMGLVCRVQGLKSEANAANVIIIKSEKGVCSEFYSNFLSSENGQKQIHAQGIGGAQEVFNTSLAKKLKIPVLPLSEQLEIAQILTTIREKIDVLKEKRQSYQDLKKGLMQQLLKGKIRVNQTIQNHDTVKPGHLQPTVEC